MIETLEAPVIYDLSAGASDEVLDALIDETYKSGRAFYDYHGKLFELTVEVLNEL